MHSNEKKEWLRLQHQGEYTTVKQKIQRYLAREQADPEALTIAKQIFEQQYELEKAAAIAQKMYQYTSSPENALNLAECLIRIGSLDKATRTLEERSAELNTNPRFYYLKGKIDGWATAKVGARVERLVDDNSTGINSLQVNYSARDEQHIILKTLLSLRSSPEKVLVDIGASDGVAFSNSRHLIDSHGWGGLLIEPNPEKASLLALNNSTALDRTSIVVGYAKSRSITGVLQAFEIPTNFGFLTLDIDSFEYQIADALLNQYRPRLICIEINERIPPPVHFHVCESGAVPPALLSGCSISSACSLLMNRGYVPFELHYNNLFAVLESDSNEKLSSICARERAESLYKLGFLDIPDSFSVYSWNKDWRPLIELGLTAPNDFLVYLSRLLDSKYSDVAYSLYIK